MTRLENFIASMIPCSCNKHRMDPTPTADEERLFFLAMTGTSKRPPLLRMDSERPDRFFITQGIGKGPYHLLDGSPNDGIYAREYISQIAALSCLYYDYEIPSSNLKFEFNYRHSKTRHWPMDIVVLREATSQDLLLYVEAKKKIKDIQSLCIYLDENPAPDFDVKDRGVKFGDNIRKAKYLWSTRVPYLWLAYPENVGNPSKQFFMVDYDEHFRRIRLLPITSGIENVKANIR